VNLVTGGTSTNEEELLSLLDVSGVEIPALSTCRPLKWKSKTERAGEIFNSPLAEIRGRRTQALAGGTPATQRISAVPAYFVRGTTLSAVNV